MKDKLVIATRAGVLATAQAEIVRTKLKAAGIDSELLFVSTKGDQDRISSLDAIGGDGLFVRRLEEEIISERADIAVHSAKDLPFELMDGLDIFSVPDEQDYRDVLLMRKGAAEENALIGSSSMRRRDQYAALNPTARFENLRGNVTTRLKKLEQGEYDGIILAKAGLNRIGVDISAYDCRVFDVTQMVPAACQGLMAIECTKDDEELIGVLKSISVPSGMERLLAERYLFKKLGAKCSNPTGVHADIEGDELKLTGYYNGKTVSLTGKTAEYRELSERICRDFNL